MSECTHDCNSCTANCSSREGDSGIQKAALNDQSRVKKVIGVVSGKGGVGKSSVTALLSVMFNRKGYNTAILDADITGPSIPKVFGISGQRVFSDGQNLMLPVSTETGIDIISADFFLKSPSDPVVWRGSLISSIVCQFWTDVVWGDVDYMFVDMPPGTGDVPLTVFQSLPLDGIILVTTPQDLVSMIVEKAVKMANMMNMPILGIIENMSFFECPDCGKKYYPFGESHVEKIAAEYNLPLLGRLPIDAENARLCDSGKIEMTDNVFASEIADLVEEKLSK